MRRRLFAIPVSLVLGVLGLLGDSSRAHAQLEPDTQSYGVYQNDRLAAEIFREDTSGSNYTEHWVLYPNYVYPNTSNSVVSIVRASGRRYSDLADFVARVPWSAGSRYVEAACNDGDALPTGR